MQTDIPFWVALSFVRGIGAVRFRLLLETFGSAREAWEAPQAALAATRLPASVLRNLLALRAELDVQRVWNDIQAQGIQVLTWEDAAYPERLQSIPQPPPVLYLRGALSPDDSWAVAVVGTRRVTRYGRQVAEEIATGLARHGVTLVSGLARGVDGVAHRAAMQAGGRTLAVLGCGVDHIYPPEHRALAADIIDRGALISDYPPGTPPDAANFPARNRLISGLSLATIVVEAGETSGALITARFAAEQGRDVFAVPGGIYAPLSKGTNRLLKQGAHPLLCVEDVLEALDLSQVQEYRQARLALPENPLERALLEHLRAEPLHVDELRALVNQPIAQVSAALTMMELKGLVRQVGAMHYVAVREAQAGYDAPKDAHEQDV